MSRVGKIAPALAVLVIMAALVAGCGDQGGNFEQRGDRYYRNGQYDDALAEYLMAEKTSGPNAGLLRRIGKVYVIRVLI